MPNPLRLIWQAFNPQLKPHTFFLKAVEKIPAQLPLSTNSPVEEILFEDYTSLIEYTKAHLAKRGWKKIVMSRHKFLSASLLPPHQLFKNLCALYPGAHVYLFQDKQLGTWIGATPELLIARKGDNVTSMSLAGTQTEIQAFTTKEYEEQQPVTDYISGVFKSSPTLKDIKVLPTEAVKAGNIYHLRSMVSAKAKESFDILKLAAKLHPTPAVSGFPKTESIDYILEKEIHDREFYSGYFGFIGGNEDHFYVNLRCAKLVANGALLFAGGGITPKSDARAEWDETENKMATLLKMFNA